MKKIHLLVLFTLLVSLRASSRMGDEPVNNGCAISTADKMNMFYIGLDNPISVSAQGYKPDQIEATISGGGTFVQTSPGHYLLKPDGSVRLITITISAKMDGDHVRRLNQQDFRVRKIPHPEVLFGSKNGGSISHGEISTVSAIYCGLGEGFAFEGLRYTVDSYTLVIAKAEGPRYKEDVTGNRVTEAGRAALNEAKAGDFIVICNVEATGPAGKVVLSGVTLAVK